MQTQIHPWDIAKGALTHKLIQTLHVPSSKFRISPHEYSAETQFGGSARAQRFYLIAGTCEYRIGESTWKMDGPCYADIPEGEFSILVGPTSVKIVQVWELPSGFHQ